MRKVSLKVQLALLSVLALAVFALPTFAQTPEPPPSMAEMLTSGQSIITDLGVLPIIFVGAIVFIAVQLFRRFKRAAG